MSILNANGRSILLLFPTKGYLNKASVKKCYLNKTTKHFENIYLFAESHVAVKLSLLVAQRVYSWTYDICSIKLPRLIFLESLSQTSQLKPRKLAHNDMLWYMILSFYCCCLTIFRIKRKIIWQHGDGLTDIVSWRVAWHETKKDELPNFNVVTLLLFLCLLLLLLL